MAEPCVSLGAAARHLGVVKDTLYGWIATNGLPAQDSGSSSFRNSMSAGAPVEPALKTTKAAASDD